MAYRECLNCGAVTDENESKCSSCGKAYLNDKIITCEELAFRIKKGEIIPSKIWTKSPREIYQALKSLPA